MSRNLVGEVSLRNIPRVVLVVSFLFNRWCQFPCFVLLVPAPGGGGGILSYIGYIVMVFEPFWPQVGYLFLADFGHFGHKLGLV